MKKEKYDVETGYSRRGGDNRYRAPYHDEKGEIRIRKAKKGKVKYQTYDPRPGGRLRADWKNYDNDDSDYKSKPEPEPSYRDGGRTKQRLKEAGLRDISGHSDYNEKVSKRKKPGTGNHPKNR